MSKSIGTVLGVDIGVSNAEDAISLINTLLKEFNLCVALDAKDDGTISASIQLKEDV